jgi:hypothetical protein
VSTHSSTSTVGNKFVNVDQHFYRVCLHVSSSCFGCILVYTIVSTKFFIVSLLSSLCSVQA